MAGYGLDHGCVRSVVESVMSHKDMWIKVNLPASHIALRLLTYKVFHDRFLSGARQAAGLEAMGISSEYGTLVSP
jgi:hypothetical protein